MKRRQISPVNIKKHSKMLGERSDTPSAGLFLQDVDKVETATGYVVPGTKNKHFETYLEVLAPGSHTARVLHPKKIRTVRPVSGFLCVCVVEDEHMKVTALKLGQEHVIAPGIEHSFVNTHGAPATYVITQEAAYAAHVEEKCPAVPYTGDLSSFTRVENEPTVTYRRTGSSSKVARMAAAELARSKGIAVADAQTRPVGIGPRPSLGNFDESGAG